MNSSKNERCALRDFKRHYKADMNNGRLGTKLLCGFCCFDCEEKVINKYIKEARKEKMAYKYVDNVNDDEKYFIVLFNDTDQIMEDKFYELVK